VSVVATGLGAVSAVGTSRGSLWEALAGGLDGIRPIQRFAIDGIPSLLGGLVPGVDARRDDPHAHRGLSIELAITAAREAWAHARLDHAIATAASAPHRIALVVGTSIGDDLRDPTPLDEVTAAIADALGITGPRITVSTACTSSTNAIGLAKDLLDAGVVDVAIAGGTDVLTPEIYAGFHAIGVLSPQKCAPYSEPFGTTLGEGAGFLVLERRAAADARSATAYVAVCGYGLSADAFHETGPDPSGSGVARAIDGALATSGVTPREIDYVNTHGTGTQANDPAEWRALVRVFGDHSEHLPVSSSKAMLGHAQGAAGVLEMLTTIIAMREGVIPQTLQFTRPRAHGPRDPVGQSRPRPGRIGRAVCTNSAFGGANAAVVLADPALPATSPARHRDVFVRGVGAVGPHGTTLDALGAALAAGVPLPSFEAVPFAIESIAPTVSPRGLNPSTKFLTSAAALALADASCRPRKGEQERAGLVVGTTAVSPQTADEFRASIDQRGFAQLSAAAFARMVMNAPAGACSKLLALKGPGSTLDSSAGGGLVAIIYAANLLATRDDADVIVAGGFDELDRGEPHDGLAEGAGCAVLGTSGPTSGLPIRIAGWGLAGAGRWSDARDAALGRAGLAPTAIDATFGDAPALGRPHVDARAILGDAPAACDVFAFIAAVLALRRCEIRTALIGCARSSATTAALVLTTLESPDGSRAL
jgi:3-oxoacyl-[acyl-carrier-protein] synthase II